ncbi:hypothetical protein BLNAU_3213 [Blattamonas nauphoetae]|uniref:Uncharacterized protein n=1 Tax=Blattamonas nauphoetae TaxID=2049346 RepID=A0ABQ9YDQ0_9EUKA|nr:hypothetical protein BLNAU_3213 [Blattamonas nauphoetae]
MVLSNDISPFLTWNPKAPVTADSASSAFVTLVSMVRDGLYFENALVNKASQLPKLRRSICGFGYCALIVVPCIDSQEYSHLGVSISHLSVLHAYQYQR